MQFAATSYDGILKFFVYYFLMNTMLPISLITTIEVVKVMQAQFVRWDAEIYDVVGDRPAKVSNCSLMEELGQIHYLFSDKTGTLTRNEMKMKAIAIGSTTYGNFGDVTPVTKDLATKAVIGNEFDTLHKELAQIDHAASSPG